MRRKIFAAALIACAVCAFGAAKTTKKLTAEGNPTRNRDQLFNALPVLYNRSVDDLDTLFDLTTGLSADVVTKSYSVNDSIKVTSLKDDVGRRFLGVTEKYSLTMCGDFDTSEANATEQSIVVDSLPVYARLMDAWVICTDSIQLELDSAQAVVSLEIGSTSGGAEIMAAADVDAENDIGAMSVTQAYDLAPSASKTAVFLSATPDSNFTQMYRGGWDVYLQYIDNESY